MIPLSHIYTYMNLGLFTNIALIGLLKHIYRYVFSSGSHQVSSGFRISSGSHRVLFIHHWIPYGGTDFPTDLTSHVFILDEPFVMVACQGLRVLDNGSTLPHFN